MLSVLQMRARMGTGMAPVRKFQYYCVLHSVTDIYIDLLYIQFVCTAAS